MLAEPDERIVDVVHSKHDAQVAESIHRGVPVIGDHRRRDKSRELDPAVAVWRAHHGDLNTLIAQSSDAPCPRAFYHSTPFEFEAELSEKSDSGIEGLHHDAHVVHAFKRHVPILYYIVRPVNELIPVHRGHQRQQEEVGGEDEYGGFWTNNLQEQAGEGGAERHASSAYRSPPSGGPTISEAIEVA